MALNRTMAQCIYSITKSPAWFGFIAIFGIIAIVFDWINEEDLEFDVFQAFVKLNFDNSVVGPLALQVDKEQFTSAKFQCEMSDIGHFDLKELTPMNLGLLVS